MPAKAGEDEAREKRRHFERAASELVGVIGLKEVLDIVRKTMVEQALHCFDGNRTKAADLLEIDRRYVARLACLHHGVTAQPKRLPAESQ